jgi:hypothetical protein
VTPRRRTARALRAVRVLVALVLAGVLFGAAPGRAQDDGGAPSLAGYQGTAQADGLHALYNPSGILPIPPPVDLGAPDALATIASGPATFARASVLDPGDLLANPGALLAQASTAYKSGTIPPYPFRVSATSGVGAPTAESNPAPGLHARVEVGEGTSSAVATMPAVDAPAIATLGTLSSRATATTDGDRVTVHAVTQASGFDLLGLVHVDSIVTDLTATADGGTTRLSGGTRVVGATLAGIPITIDADGIHATSGKAGLLGGIVSPLVDNLNRLLGQAGIHVTVAGPVQLQGASGPGQLSSSGLRVDVEISPRTFPAIAQLRQALPPIDSPVPGLPSIEDVLALASATHLASLDVGRGMVALDATGVPPADDGSGATGTDGTDGTTPSFDGLPLPGVGVDLPTGPSASVPTGSRSLAPVSSDERTAVPLGVGVGGLVLLALLAQPLLGERIARACGTVLDAGRADTCRWEER